MPTPRALGAAILLLVLIALPARAQDQLGPPAPLEDPGHERIHLRLIDGARIIGELVRETESEIVIEINGVEATVAVGRIARIERLPSVEEQYRANRRLIGDHDVGQLLNLVDWLVAHERYAIALRELDGILERSPGNRAASDARLAVLTRMRLLQQKAPEGAGAPNGRPENDFPLLTEEQVNLLKVYEVDLTDPPRMLIEPQTVQDLIAAFADDPRIPQTPEGREALASRSEAELLALMFELQARDFYGRVRVLDLPVAFKRFREDVHGRWLLNRCASPRCHGGAGAGRLRLANPPRRANRDEVMLTNFLILERFRTTDGKPLIDYDRPDRSPLLHLAIQRDNSLSPHPAVAGPRGLGDLWRPQFRTERDPGALATQDWIRSMYLPRPDYPIEFAPPQADSAPASREEGKPR